MGEKFNFKRLGEPFEADWPVVVSVPQDGGTTINEEFTARFRLIPDTEMPAIIAADKDGKEVYRRCWVGFGKETNQEFTPEIFDQVLSVAYTRDALMAAYRKFAGGIAVKN